jgi:adenylate kinase
VNLVFLGPPGSGKSTQADRLAKELGVIHISTGAMLRQAVEDDAPLGRRAGEYISRGQLVPDELVIGLIDDWVASSRMSDGFILDGFPRTVPQAEGLTRTFQKYGMALDKVILLTVQDSEILKRLLSRAGIEGRADDTEEVIMNRIQVYHRQTRLIESYYRRLSLLVEVPGDDTPDNVFAAVQKAAR